MTIARGRAPRWSDRRPALAAGRGARNPRKSDSPMEHAGRAVLGTPTSPQLRRILIRGLRDAPAGRQRRTGGLTTAARGPGHGHQNSWPVA